MKHTSTTFILILFLSVFCLNSSAQTPSSTATLGVTLQCAGGTNNRAGIAYNPNQQFYYSINAGAGSYPIETFSSTGTPLASIASGYSYRGLWWHSATNTLEGKVYSSAGIVQQNLDASFYPLGTGTTIVAGSGPDIQSCGDYDWVDDEVLYYFSGSIYRYDRSTHTLISSVAITGLPVATGNLNNNTAAYTGIAGMEAGVYDYVNKAFYFINKTTGAYVTTCQLPSTAPGASSFQMGFDNDLLWLYNTATSQWESYNVINNCETQNSITETACTSYTSPSGNYTWTVSDVYTDTIPNAAGCDSIISIDLTIIPEMTGVVNDTICFNGSVVVNGNTYDAQTPTGTEIFTNVGPNGCDSTVTINLSVLPAIDLAVTNVGTTLTSDQAGATYQWIDCDNNTQISGETNQSYTPTVTGNYAVVVTMNNCSDTSACTLVDFTGIEELTISGKELIMIIDLTGRQTEFTPNTPLIFIYSDGTRERVMEIE